jgi:hypothetical protein
MSSFADVKKRASLPTTTLSLCLAGELADELEQLERQLAETPKAANLGDDSRRLLVEQIEAKRNEMREATVDFKLRSMNARMFQTFWTSMPTRNDDETQSDWNERIFPWECELVARTVIDPVMTADEVAELVDLLNLHSWNLLAQACMNQHNKAVDLPNSDAASELTETSEQT